LPQLDLWAGRSSQIENLHSDYGWLMANSQFIVIVQQMIWVCDTSGNYPAYITRHSSTDNLAIAEE
jgi:hypothetical protein